MAKVGTSNQDRTISLKAAVRSCIFKKKKTSVDEDFSVVVYDTVQTDVVNYAPICMISYPKSSLTF